MLTQEQERVVNFEGSRLLVVAGPGTGKTRTIIDRMVRLLAENPERLVSLLTFTRASSNDTRKIVKAAVGGDAVGDSQIPRISTLHTFATSLVRRYAQFLELQSDFSVVADDGEKEILFTDVLEDTDITLSTKELAEAVKCYRSTDEWAEDDSLSSSQRLAAIKVFERLLHFYNALDFEGTVWEARRLLSQPNISIGPLLLQVDEYQDLNPVDQRLVHLAGSMAGSQVVVVGDDAQSIYSRRHAHFRGLRELWNSPEWETVKFRTCFRLPPHVLRAANALIKSRGYLGADVDLPQDDGTRVTTLQCSDENIQLRAIAEKISQLKEEKKTSDGKMLRYGDFMILCPIPSKAKKAQSTLMDLGIPARLHPGPGVPDSVRDLLLVLRMVMRDNLALRQWLPHAGLPQTVMTSVRRDAMAGDQTLFDYCSKVDDPVIRSVLAAVEEIRKHLVDDPGEFAKHLGRFPGLSPDQEVRALIDELAVHVPAVGRMRREILERFGAVDRDDSDVEDDHRNEVLITTLYSAKGLEAEFVFVSWMNSQYFPSGRTDPEEAERLLYVALTRAKQDVFLTFHEEYHGKKRIYREAMSPLLQSISDHLEITVVRAPDLK